MLQVETKFVKISNNMNERGRERERGVMREREGGVRKRERKREGVTVSLHEFDFWPGPFSAISFLFAIEF